ncbi:hypothetical protein PG999_004039 [Apiospora kogelbergensis]|uniref:Uncharacterized protein n=1 Tax=Apiospora kogelbergensis TaxID=1337665 RepID=A0AAW0R5H2_9PEZI
METEPATPPKQEAVGSANELYHAICAAFPRAVANFNSKWNAAHPLCTSLASSNGAICQGEDEFITLRRLGPKIIPFVVFKLASDAADNLWAVFLYHTLEEDPAYRPSPDCDLQRQRRQIVELNYQRNKLAEERIRNWQTHCRENSMHSVILIYTSGDEYFDLLDMGPGIIAHLMVEYYHNQGDFYYELLHEIIHGRQTGAMEIQKPYQFHAWTLFFEDIDHDKAPKYRPNDWERQLSFWQDKDPDKD